MWIRAYFFFNDTPPTETYTLSLHDALPIFGSQMYRDARCRSRSDWCRLDLNCRRASPRALPKSQASGDLALARSEEHTSELQSRRDLVCRLLLEKKNTLTSQGKLFLNDGEA